MADQILYDAWGRPVRPAARHRASNFHAIPNGYQDPYNYSGGPGADLHRARSHGHGPAPNIHIYNDMVQDNDAPPSNAPRGRSSYRNGELAPEAAGGGGGRYGGPPHHAGGRSRSRSSMSPGAWDREMRMARLLQREEEEEAKRREEAAIADYRRRQEEESRERKDIIRQAKMDEEDKTRKEKERKAEIIRQAKLDDEAAKAKEEKEYQEFERKQKQKEADKKAKEAKDKEEYQERVRRDFAKFGLSDNQIEHMVNHDKEKDEKKRGSKHRHSSSGALVVAGGGNHGSGHLERPTFPKIHRHDIAIETLQYYDLSWEHDKRDPDFIIILHEMNTRETDILFEHTRRLKSKKLISDGKDKKDGTEWVVKRSKSRGKSRDRSRSGIRERFAENLVRHM